MTRTFVAALVISVLSLPADAAPTRRVDIGDNEALEALRVENPVHYRKVMSALRDASADVSCETLPQMLKVQYGAQDVTCAVALIRTSYPAKRWIAFTLDEVAFSGNVVIIGPPPTLQKADNLLTRP